MESSDDEHVHVVFFLHNSLWRYDLCNDSFIMAVYIIKFINKSHFVVLPGNEVSH